MSDPTPAPEPATEPSASARATLDPLGDAPDAGALQAADASTVLAPSAAQDPAPAGESSETGTGGRETAAGGLELLRQLIIQRAPDEFLLLDDGDSGTVPASLQTATLLQELDRVRDSVTQDSRTEDVLVASTATIASGLSVGYVAWLVRGGLLMSSLVSSLPAWRMVDPLPVLGRMGDEEEEDDDDDPGRTRDEGLDELVEASGQGAMEES